MRESTIIFLPLEEDDIRAVIRRPDTKAKERDDDHEDVDVRRGAAADDRPAAGDPQQQE